MDAQMTEDSGVGFTHILFTEIMDCRHNNSDWILYVKKTQHSNFIGLTSFAVSKWIPWKCKLFAWMAWNRIYLRILCKKNQQQIIIIILFLNLLLYLMHDVIKWEKSADFPQHSATCTPTIDSHFVLKKLSFLTWNSKAKRCPYKIVTVFLEWMHLN